MGRYSSQKLPSDVLKNMAENFRALRKFNKLSRAECAERSGVPEPTIRRFEVTGKIALESLLKLAFGLNRLEDFDLIFQFNDQEKNLDKLFSSKTKRG